MEFHRIFCRKCGGSLTKDGGSPSNENVTYVCSYCGAEFSAQSNADYAAEVKKLFGDALAEQKEEQIANIRSNLYAAAHETFADSAKIVGYCRELKKLLPDDFQAAFYETANSASAQELAAFLGEIDFKARLPFLGDMAEFLIKSLRSETVNSVAYFIDSLQKVDPLLHAEWTERFFEEAQKVEDGIYDVSVPRDVFVAYRSSDLQKVVQLVNFLEDEEGLKCFVSYRNLQHGRGAKSNYDEYLRRAMDSCKVLVFVSSVTSRAQGDARNKELPYVYSQDLSRAPAEFGARGDYKKLPRKYKKPRVEYIIESYKNTASDEYVKTFFDGFTRRETPREVAEAVFEIYDGNADFPAEPVQQQPKKIKYCSECGAENDGDVKFCRNCGNGKFLSTHEEYLDYKNRHSEEARRREAEKKAEAERLKAERRAETERIRAEGKAEVARIRAESRAEALRAKQENKRQRAERRAERRERAGEILGSVGEGIGRAAAATGRGIAAAGRGIGIAAAAAGKGIGIAFLYFFDPATVFGKVVFVLLTLGGIGLGFFNMAYPFNCGRQLVLAWGDSVWIYTLIAFAAILLYDIIAVIVASIKNYSETNDNAVAFFILCIVGGLIVIGGISILISWLADDVITFWLIYGIMGGLASGGFAVFMLAVIFDSVNSMERVAGLVPFFNAVLAFTIGASCYALMYVAQHPPEEQQSAAIVYCIDEEPAYGELAAGEYNLLYEN